MLVAIPEGVLAVSAVRAAESVEKIQQIYVVSTASADNPLSGHLVRPLLSSGLASPVLVGVPPGVAGRP